MLTNMVTDSGKGSKAVFGPRFAVPAIIIAALALAAVPVAIARKEITIKVEGCPPWTGGPEELGVEPWPPSDEDDG
jgi:hypothetical protein